MHACTRNTGHRLLPWAALAFFAIGLLPVAPPAYSAVLQQGSIVIEHDPADEAVARRSLEVLQTALTSLRNRLPDDGQPVRIVICHTYEDFRRYAGRYAAPGVGGVAMSDSGFIAIKAPRIQRPEADYEGILRHELIHLLLARNYNVRNIPRWLNEGITMVLSEERRWDDRTLVSYLYLRGNLIAYRDLEFAIELDEERGRIGEAYAQSLSMTEFMMKRLGEDRFWSLIRSLDTRSFDQALRAETGLEPQVFWDEWRRSLWKFALVFSLVSGFSAFQLMVLLAALAYWRLRRKNRATLRQWQKEEEEDDDIPYLFAHELEGQEAPYPWEEDEEEGRS